MQGKVQKGKGGREMGTELAKEGRRTNGDPWNALAVGLRYMWLPNVPPGPMARSAPSVARQAMLHGPARAKRQQLQLWQRKHQRTRKTAAAAGKRDTSRRSVRRKTTLAPYATKQGISTPYVGKLREDEDTQMSPQRLPASSHQRTRRKKCPSK